MANSKVVFGEETLIDLTSDTVTADTLADGYTAHGADGTAIVGTMTSGGSGEPTDGDYLVQFIGYRGEVYQTGRYNTGDTVSVPADPSHDGLVFDGWSSPVTVTDNTVTVTNQDLTIGAMFDTVSGATEIDITLTVITGLTATIALFNNVTSIDWGDGETSTALGSHTYSDYGDYTIMVYASGDMSDGTSTSNLFGATSSSTPNRYCTNARFGGDMSSIGTYAFYSCNSLTSATIPSGVTSIGTYAFYSCYSLTSVTIPSSVTSIGTYAYQYCYSLTSVTIPSGVTSIGTYAYQYCYNLTSATIPSSVTSIGTYAFRYCRTLKIYDLTAYTSSDATPTLMGTNVFTSISSICKMLFRDQDTLDNFASASNWSTYANYMYVKE